MAKINNSANVDGHRWGGWGGGTCRTKTYPVMART